MFTSGAMVNTAIEGSCAAADEIIVGVAHEVAGVAQVVGEVAIAGVGERAHAAEATAASSRRALLCTLVGCEVRRAFPVAGVLGNAVQW